MQAGGLYYHFDSKGAIVEEVLAVGLEHARDAIRAALNAAGDEASGHAPIDGCGCRVRHRNNTRFRLH